ncbi:hypothetical protein GN956_G6472 [Arapaima gigas]
MLDPGASECTGGLDASQTESSCLDWEDLNFQSSSRPDSSFGEWCSFDSDLDWNLSDRCTFSPTSSPPKHQDVNNHHTSDEQLTWPQRKTFEWSHPQQMFHSCFPSVEEASTETSITDPRTLSQLLQGSPESPSSSSAVPHAATLWNKLLPEPGCPQLSAPSRRPQSHSVLLSVLGVTPARVASQQGALPAERQPEESDGESAGPRSAALIQTKLLPPPKRRDGPGFLYQISQQWLSQCSLGLQGHNPPRSFLP